MADRPILFSTPMIQALLAGTKSQTRRIIKPQPPADIVRHCWYDAPLYGFTRDDDVSKDWHVVRLLAYKGDRLWVRESFSYDRLDVDHDRFMDPWYWADGNPKAGDWTRPKPSIHMPRAYSRITLLVDDVKVERLQDISYADAIAEGVEAHDGMDANCMGYRDYSDPDRQHWVNSYVSYATLWDSINEKRGVPWKDNPWVVAYTFRVVLENIDYIGKAAA